MAELSVSRKNISQLLSLDDPETKGKIYVIPDYQRPYCWDNDRCETLWNDLTNFYDEIKADPTSDREYFLGTIVTCIDTDNKAYIDIIDGQQRITSLFLLLRAIYTKLIEMMAFDPTDKEITGLMSSIEPCIWTVNKLTKEVDDKSVLHIKSFVATEDDNEVFHKILETGEVPEGNKSTYATNYNFFLEKYKKYISDTPKNWKNFCLTIIDRCIVLPIVCDNFESALSIFGTLNDRGMQLADSDIFKAKLYKLKPTKAEKTAFTQAWKELEQTVKESKFTLDLLFRYYTHIIRGLEGNNKKEIALRRFYAGENSNYNYFKEPDFFDNICKLADFWAEANLPNSMFNEDDCKFCNTEAKKFIHCLNCYPNDYWKYVSSVFFFVNKDKPDFKPKFADFLKRLTAYMYIKFVESPTVNNVKDPIFSFCIEVAKKGDANFSYTVPAGFKDTLSSYATSKIAKPMILLDAYLFDPAQDLIPDNFEIEHIFPQKWQDTNYNGWTKTDADKYLNTFGNRIAFEKKLNIQAGNGYFGQKKKRYSASNILAVKDLSIYPNNDWLKSDIEKRDADVLSRLEDFFISTLSAAPVATTPVVLIDIKDSEEFLTVTLIGGSSMQYHIKANIKDSSKATAEQILNDEIPLVAIDTTYPDAKSLIGDLPKEFVIKNKDLLKKLL